MNLNKKFVFDFLLFFDIVIIIFVVVVRIYLCESESIVVTLNQLLFIKSDAKAKNYIFSTAIKHNICIGMLYVWKTDHQERHKLVQRIIMRGYRVRLDKNKLNAVASKYCFLV